jgi:hypothetical protein
VSGWESVCEPYREWIEEDVRRHPAATAIGGTEPHLSAQIRGLTNRMARSGRTLPFRGSAVK